MTSFAFPPKTIEELDQQLEIMYYYGGKPKDWEEHRQMLIESYELKEENNEASDTR
ncbi:hypothetical protein H8D29_05755 [PVC group bacterium]|nr:hypothetical protein [PVC group bacterium]